MFVKMVFQGELGARSSRFYKSINEAQRVQSRLDELEVKVSGELSGFMGRVWPEVEVLMFFLWPCKGDGNDKVRIRHIKAEKLLEVSACVAPEIFSGASAEERADHAFRHALTLFATAFRKYKKDAEALEMLRDRMFPANAAT